MRTLGRMCATLIMLGSLFVVTGQTPLPTSLPVGSATIAELKGEVSLRSPEGAELNAQRGLVLGPESVIETAKGSVLLDLQDGAQVLVKGHSRVVLKSPNEGKGFSLELLIGKIIAKVQKRLGTTPSFKMGTPTAVITVRGTRFSVEVTKNQRTFIEVFEGMVQVEGLLERGRPVLIQPGFSTQVDRDRGPESPRQMIGPGGGAEREDDRFNQPRTPGKLGGEGENQRPGTQQAPPSKEDNEPN